MPDINREASEFWNSLKPMIDEEIKAQTRGMVQRRKMKVTTAPSLNTNKIGVTEPFGTEMFIPFTTNLISATVGDVVWVEFMYGLTNAFASMFASADEKDWDIAGNLSVVGNAGIGGNLGVSGSTSLQNTTVNGVLDITPRRCYAELSSAGWHRVFGCGWSSGSSIKISIGVNAAEYHDVDLIFNTGTSFEFSCEVSKGSSSLLIDKIRAWLDQSNNYVYIDLHQSISNSSPIMVMFSPKGDVVRRELLGVSWAKMQTYDFVDVDDSPAVGSLAAEHGFSVNNTPVHVQEPSSLLDSGTIAASGTLYYEATVPCWVYLMFVMQANSSGSINIKLNNIDIVNWTSGEAIPVNFAFMPIPLMPGNTLYVVQSSNRASTYKIFAMR